MRARGRGGLLALAAERISRAGRKRVYVDASRQRGGLWKKSERRIEATEHAEGTEKLKKFFVATVPRGDRRSYSSQ